MMSSLSAMLSLAQFGAFGYWIIFLISFAEAFVFTGWVVPGTVVVVIAGGLSAHGIYDFWALVFFATVGAILGDAMSYELGKRGKVHVAKHPSLNRHLDRGRAFVQKHHGKSIVLGRFIGWIRPIVPFIAGLTDMGRTRFYFLNTLSGIAWAMSYLALGYFFETAWKVVLVGFGRIALVLLIPLALLALLLWLWQWILGHSEGLLCILLSILGSVRTGMNYRAAS